MRRRTVLMSLGAFALAGGAVYGGSLGACALAAPLSAARLGDPRRLFAGLRDLPDPVSVGRAALDAGPPARLRGVAELRRLARKRRVVEACAIACPNARSAALAEVIGDEFRAARTVIAGRWVVSQTEAEIAALWALDRDATGAVRG